MDGAVIGMVLIPTPDLGKDISVENILKILNSGEQLFDFNYKPKDLDWLLVINRELKIISRPSVFFKLIYENGKWREGGLSKSHSNLLAAGKIKHVEEAELEILKENLLDKELRFKEDPTKNNKTDNEQTNQVELESEPAQPSLFNKIKNWFGF
ncbi:MAG: hypothetical protein ACJAWV_002298 [Flammeovirgaceae bacterium]|jgi:hypothetical protein